MTIPNSASLDGRPVRRIVIVGGGSAGWIAAARIAARNAKGGGDGIAVTLIESATTPTIGVGEGTWPTMRNTLAKIGITETEFIRGSDAAFKQGARFVGWTHGTADDAYYHPLNPPVGATEMNLSPHWAALSETREVAVGSFAGCVDFQEALCNAGLAPKLITHPEYCGTANYAYHLDAGKFASLLRDHAVGRLGVRHIVADVVGVEQDESGDIQSLKLSGEQEVPGDLFIDCSGFKGVLIGGVYKVPLRERRNILFADRALAMQVPYPAADTPIVCHTEATAQDAGWIWDIGLWTRRGVGYVYSSAHTTNDEAERTLRRYVGPTSRDLNIRRIDINAGHRQIFWKNNCVAVGLSAGFLEPLEASALMLIEISMDAIADRLPRTRRAMDVLAKQFNQTFDHHWDRAIEFLKLHYVLTKRTDTAFWRDNVERASIPDSLQERLELWEIHPPSAQDFTFAREVFSWPSYQYILHGMKYPTRYAELPTLAAERLAAERLLSRAAALRSDALRRLPDHRGLLGKIRDHGLQLV
jgi:tryptophan halogenase